MKYSLYNVKGELIATGSRKMLSFYVEDVLGIRCSTDAIYRSAKTGVHLYGMTLALASDPVPVLQHGFSTSNKVYKYFGDVLVASYNNMYEAADDNDLYIDALKEHMYNLTPMSSGAIYTPYRMGLMEMAKMSKTTGEFKGEVLNSVGELMFKYNGRKDLQLKLNCEVTAVSSARYSTGDAILLNNGIRIRTDNACPCVA